MKTLNNQIIIYDQDCPMCALYTNAFIKSGMLDKEGRESYQTACSLRSHQLDPDRARNEIALVNSKDGSVRYGLDSLMFILRHRWPWLRPLFSWSPLYRIMNAFYKFISYNRKVIAPAPVYQAPRACTPDFHLGWRITYLVVIWIITSLLLINYMPNINSLLQLSNSYGRESLICGGQLIWQGAAVLFWHRSRRLEYLGNMMTVSLAGAILLLPGQWILEFAAASQLAFVGWFMLVVFLMMLEHIRRVKRIGITPWLTVTWVLYRLTVLTLLLTL